MLNKLLDHEMKAIARMLLPLYLVLAVLTVIDRIVINLNIFTGFAVLIPGFITFTYVILILAVVVVSAVVVVLRFYKNLVQDEGYLMFTLPVKTSQLINSKLISSLIWTGLSTLVVIASLLGAFANAEFFVTFWDEIKFALTEAMEQLGGYFVLFVIELLILIFSGIVSNILHLYASIAIGQLFNGHKILGSFAAYLVTNIAMQIISTVAIFIGSLLFKNLLTKFISVPLVILPATIVLVLVFNVVFYYVTHYIFKNKLNLE